VKFKEFQVREYRKTGLQPEKIVALFEEFRSGVGRNRKPRNVGFHFLQFLRTAVSQRASSTAARSPSAVSVLCNG
jgi:hypothetical protein